MSLDTVRVFLASPYRDMQAERAYLHDVVFPRVSQKYQENGRTLEVIDPRRLATNEDDAEGVETLDAALDEVAACRPHFLCLLGSNYGKVTLEVPDPIGRKHPAVRHFFRTSRVHLETLTGVIREPEQAAHAFFYFRNPAFLNQVDASDRGTFVPNNKMDALNEIEAHKLEIFKEAIRNTGRPVCEYGCTWDGLMHQVTGLEELGARIENDLLSIIGLAGEAPVAAAVVEETVPGSMVTEEVAAGVLVAGAAVAGAAVAGVAIAGAAAASGEAGGWEAMAEEEVAGVEPVASEPMEAAAAFADDAMVDQVVAEVSEVPADGEAMMADGEAMVAEEPVVDEMGAEAAADEAFATTEEPVLSDEPVNDADAEAAAAGIFGDEEAPAAPADDNPFEVDSPVASDDDQPADIVEVSDDEEGEPVEVVAEEEEAPKKKKGWFGKKK